MVLGKEILVGGIAALLIGCSGQAEEEQAASTGLQSLQDNREKWAEADIGHYRFTYKRVCFCLPEDNIVIEVEDGTVESAVYAESGQAVDPARLAELQSIEQLFDMIAEAFANNAHAVRAGYNDAYGYPFDVYIDYDQMIADEELGFQILKFEIMK